MSEPSDKWPEATARELCIEIRNDGQRHAWGACCASVAETLRRAEQRGRDNALRDGGEWREKLGESLGRELALRAQLEARGPTYKSHTYISDPSGGPRGVVSLCAQDRYVVPTDVGYMVTSTPDPIACRECAAIAARGAMVGP